MTLPATEKQISYIEALMRQRDISGVADRISALMEKLDRKTASDAIGILRGLPYKSAPVKATCEAIDLTPVPAGRYAVPGNDGKLKFVIIDKPTDGKWKGVTFAKVQASDDLWPLGRQYPGQSYSGKAPELIKAILANPSEASKAYGLELGKCGVCGRTLTDEESRAKGIGPICAEKYGW